MTLVPSLALVILDGWGLAPPGPGNAVSLAETPVFDRLWAAYPHTELSAQGRDVGRPPGQMGNSEVGHLNLGAGAIVPQDLARIDKAVEDDQADRGNRHGRAVSTIAANEAASSDAPPTSAPSTSGRERISAALPGLTEPP